MGDRARLGESECELCATPPLCDDATLAGYLTPPYCTWRYPPMPASPAGHGARAQERREGGGMHSSGPAMLSREMLIYIQLPSGP